MGWNHQPDIRFLKGLESIFFLDSVFSMIHLEIQSFGRWSFRRKRRQKSVHQWETSCGVAFWKWRLKKVANLFKLHLHSPFFSWSLKWSTFEFGRLLHFHHLPLQNPPDLRLYMFIINEIYLQLGEEIDGMSYLGSKAIWLDCSVKLFFFVTVWQVGFLGEPERSLRDCRGGLQWGSKRNGWMGKKP